MHAATTLRKSSAPSAFFCVWLLLVEKLAGVVIAFLLHTAAVEYLYFVIETKMLLKKKLCTPQRPVAAFLPERK